MMILAAVLGMGMMVRATDETHLDPKAVDRDFRVTVVVAEPEGIGAFTVVGNLREGAVRVPLVVEGEIRYIVEVTAPTVVKNSSTLLKPQVEIRVMDPGKLVTKGEGGMEPLTLLSCRRSIDWLEPQEMTVLESEKMTMTLSVEAGEEAEGVKGEAAAE